MNFLEDYFMKRMKRMTKTPMVAALMCIALLITSLFLPYMQVTEEFVELAEAMEMETAPSLYDFALMELERGVNAVALLLGIMGGLAALVALLTWLRKPIGAILLTLPIIAEATLMHLIFAGERAYEWAIADSLIFVACGGIVISGIWMAVKKSAAKKRRTQRDYIPAQAQA